MLGGGSRFSGWPSAGLSFRYGVQSGSGYRAPSWLFASLATELGVHERREAVRCAFECGRFGVVRVEVFDNRHREAAMTLLLLSEAFRAHPQKAGVSARASSPCASRRAARSADASPRRAPACAPVPTPASARPAAPRGRPGPSCWPRAA